MLLLALLMGIGVMVLVYSMQKWDWQLHWSKIRKFLNSSNRRLVLAVISGGLATVSTYMALQFGLTLTVPGLQLVLLSKAWEPC